MSEINNNSMNSKVVNTRGDVSFKGKQSSEILGNEENSEVIISDLGNNPKEAIGRSQVKQPKNNSFSINPEMAAGINSDLKKLMNNPELIEKSDIMFAGALKKAKQNGHNDPYLQAVKVQREFVDEFSK